MTMSLMKICLIFMTAVCCYAEDNAACYRECLDSFIANTATTDPTTTCNLSVKCLECAKTSCNIKMAPVSVYKQVNQRLSERDLECALPPGGNISIENAYAALADLFSVTKGGRRKRYAWICSEAYSCVDSGHVLASYFWSNDQFCGLAQTVANCYKNTCHVNPVPDYQLRDIHNFLRSIGYHCVISP